MPRDIPVGNGNLLIAFDLNYNIREVLFPYIGEENQQYLNGARAGHLKAALWQNRFILLQVRRFQFPRLHGAMLFI